MATYSMCLPASKLTDSGCLNRYILVITGESTTKGDGTCRIVINDSLSTSDCNRLCAISDPAPKFIVTPYHKELVVLQTEMEITTSNQLSQGLGLWSCDGLQLIQDSGNLYKVEARITSWSLFSKPAFLSRTVKILPNVKFSWVFIAEGGILQPIPG